MDVVIICDTNANYLVRVCLILAQYDNKPTHNAQVPNAFVATQTLDRALGQTSAISAAIRHIIVP